MQETKRKTEDAVRINKYLSQAGICSRRQAVYEIPKDDSIGQVIITREYIEGTGGPRILLRGQEIPLIGMAQ